MLLAKKETVAAFQPAAVAAALHVQFGTDHLNRQGKLNRWLASGRR
jgi:hypothetical protein